MSKREELVILARLSEQAERYEDMMKGMKELAMLGEPLSSEERNLFSVAYKNVVGARRSAWRVLVSIKQREEDRAGAGSEAKEKSHDHERKAKQADEYINLISKEIGDICKEVVDLVDNYLLKQIEDDNESKTFYLKMKGDYYRYVAEVQDSEEQTENSEKAGEAYEAAYKICRESMEAAHPIRLGLALNYSVFYYEIKVQHEAACEIAKKAFDEALGVMQGKPDEKFKDSSLIMQLLRDNLSLWTASESEEDNDQQMA